jgi:hypothetical protein
MNFRVLTSILFLLGTTAIATTSEDYRPEGKLNLFSIPHLQIEESERVVAFEFHFTNAAIYSFSRVPECWGLEINNDCNWRTSIEGNIIVGAAALGPDCFRDFLTIDIVDTLLGESMPFPFTGKVSVETYGKENRERSILLGPKDFTLRPVAADSTGRKKGN